MFDGRNSEQNTLDIMTSVAYVVREFKPEGDSV